MGISDFSLIGKKTVIIGGRKGLGKAYAVTFAEAGADVAVADVVSDDGMLDMVAEQIRNYGCQSMTMQVDISKKTDINSFIDKIIAEFGTIDIWVNVAVRYHSSGLLDLNEQDWDVLTDTNLKGYWLACQAVVPIMIERRKGSIINMTSQAGMKTMRSLEGELGNYSITKAGIIMLTKQLAMDLAKYNIRVNAIALSRVPRDPQPTDTDALEREKTCLKWMAKHTPMKRNAEHNDIANGALYLASEASSYVTGHVLVIDGGYIL